jgi:hypothetical protein
MAGLVLLWGVGFALYDALGNSERRALARMPADERQALYTREYEAFRGLCDTLGAGALASRCRERASFLEKFPECEGACREAIRRFRQEPTR